MHCVGSGSCCPFQPEPCAARLKKRCARLLAAGSLAAQSCFSDARPTITLQASGALHSGRTPVTCIASDTVRTGQTPLGRGLLTCKNLPTNTRILSVPFEQLMLLPPSYVNLSTNKFYSKYFKKHGVLPMELLTYITEGSDGWEVRMMAWLLWLAKHGSDFWRQYIDSLPKEPEMTNLLNYSSAEQPELQLPWLIATAERQHSLALNLHKTHFSSQTGCLKSLQLASTPQDTLWAMSTVFCRSFFDKVGSRDDAALMVPLADLANHSFWPNAQYALQKAQGVFELITLRDVQPDDHICISYGNDKGNAHLMANYGFIVPGNPNQQLDFESDELATPKLLAGPLLKALGLLKYEEWLCNNQLRQEGLTQQQVATACAGDADLSRTLATVLSLPLRVDRLQGELVTTTSRQDRILQRHAVYLLQQECQQMLQAFSTDLDTDQELLASTTLTPRHEQAIKARLDHKLLVHAAQAALKTYARSLREKDLVMRGRAPKRRRKT